MRILAVELRRVHLPLVVPFRSALGTETARDALLVRVATPGGEGWGECVAMRTPSYSPETVDGAHHVVREHLVPRLFAAGDGLTAGAVGRVLGDVKGNPMAKAALELAVLDAELRAAGVPLADRLGATRDSVACGVAIGRPASVGDLLDTVALHLEEGYVRVKLKVEPGWDVEPVRAVRERFGDDLPLQVDGNGSYTLADAEHLGALDAFGLLLIEQPLPEDDLEGHAALAQRVATPICLDESITSARAAARAIAAGACAVVNVKAGRVGGYLEAVRVHDACVARGVPAWCGGMLETGIGRAANAALAALPGFTLPGDLGPSSRWYATDVTGPLAFEGGRLRVPRAPGIGVDVDRAALDGVTVAREMLAPV